MAAFNGNMISSPLSVIGPRPQTQESPPSDFTPARWTSGFWEYPGPGCGPSIGVNVAGYNTNGIIGSCHPPAGRPIINSCEQNLNIPLNNNIHVIIGEMSTDRRETRIVELSNVLIMNAREIICEMFSASTIWPWHHHVLTVLQTTRFQSLESIDSSDHMLGIFVLTFGSIIDARNASTLARQHLPAPTVVSFLPYRELPTPSRRQPRLSSCFAGQVSVSVVATPLGELNHDLTYAQLFNLLGSVGDVVAISAMALLYGKDSPTSVSLRVEYSMIASARDAILQLNGQIGRTMLVVEDYSPEIVIGRTTNWTRSQFDPTAADRFRGIPSLQLTGSPHVTDRPLGRVGHNAVDITRIMAGHDVRTTVMLRNVPNKLHQHDLEAFLNETSFGEYDFMYLRIDFANELNVGYAFINFVDPLSIVKFARARAGQFWPQVCDSNKRAEISYATIQGRDCLIQKFRNSSVMLEHPSYRPKLYYAHPLPLAGQEEPFPAPDNLSKLKRSVENAEHIGLFTVRKGTVRAVSRSAGAAMRLARYEQIIREYYERHGLVNVDDPNDPFSGQLAHGRGNVRKQQYHI